MQGLLRVGEGMKEQGMWNGVEGARWEGGPQVGQSEKEGGTGNPKPDLGLCRPLGLAPAI